MNESGIVVYAVSIGNSVARKRALHSSRLRKFYNFSPTHVVNVRFITINNRRDAPVPARSIVDVRYVLGDRSLVVSIERHLF